MELTPEAQRLLDEILEYERQTQQLRHDEKWKDIHPIEEQPDYETWKRLQLLHKGKQQYKEPAYDDGDEDYIDGTCPSCGSVLIERSHKEITQDLLDQDSYLKKWWLCLNCETVHYNEEDRVINKR